MAYRRALQRAFDRLAKGYRDHSQVQSEIGRRMLSRLDLVRLSPAVVLDAGAGTGEGAEALVQRYPGARVVALDLSWRLLREVPRLAGWRRWLGVAASPHPLPLCADFERLPLREASVDVVMSNLALNWATDLPAALCELHRVTRPGGLIMMTVLGPDTLREWQAPGSRHTALDRHLPDMHDVGDMLVAAGFAGPVMDQEHLTLSYGSARGFRRDLRHWGAVDPMPARQRGLAAPAALRSAPAGITLEVVYGHAWKPVAAPPSQRLPDGSSVIRFDRPLRK